MIATKMNAGTLRIAKTIEKGYDFKVVAKSILTFLT